MIVRITFRLWALWLLFFSYGVASATPVSSPVTCMPWQLAHRTNRFNCWAQFKTDSHQNLCFTYSAWTEWLKNPKNSRCFQIQSRWSVSQKLENSNWNRSVPKAVTLTQTVTHLTQIKKTEPVFSSLFKTIEYHREKVAELLAPGDTLGLLRSLILHQSPAHTQTESREYHLSFLRKLGFVHLISATGIHFYAFCGTWDQVVQKLTTWALRTGWITQVRTGILFGRITALISCAYLWILAGARMGMLRAGLVILIKKLAETLGFQWTRASPLIISLFLEWLAASFHLRLDSGENSSLGRWVYALSVGGGLFFHSCFNKKNNTSHWRSHLGLAVGSWVPVAILEIGKEGSISVATPILSLLTLPMICSFIYPSTIFSLALIQLGLIYPGEWILRSLAKLASEFTLLLTQFALLPGNIWMISQNTLLITIPLATFVILVRGYFHRLTFFITICVLLLGIRFVHHHSSAIDLTVEQLDVGQGDAALISGPQPGLIDTGSQNALSDEAWLNLFAQRQVGQLNWIALTHLDEDHAGGILRLAKLIPIRCITTSLVELKKESKTSFRKYLLKTLRSYQIPVFDWESASSCVPYPTLGPPSKGPKETSNQNARNENMGAVLIPLLSGGFYLSAGDASSHDEMRIGNWASEQMKISSNLGPRILKVSHHGSRYSSHPCFLKKIRPTEAWISVGQSNRYGHPAIQTLVSLKKQGIPVFRTDQLGMLSTQKVRTTEGVFRRLRQIRLQLPKRNPQREKTESPLRHLEALPLFLKEN